MAVAKLHINIQQGLIDVEGEEALVRAVYEDFKEYFATTRMQAAPISPEHDDNDAPADVISARSNGNGSPKRARARRSRTPDAQQRSGWGSYEPQQSKEPDMEGLREFFATYGPRSQSEKILTFVRFLSDEKNVVPCTADQIFTCYRVLREKMPKAFVQAFRDTASKQGWIDISGGPTSIVATIVGNNYFEHDLVKA